MFLVILQSRKYKESLTKIEKKENKFSCAHIKHNNKKKREQLHLCTGKEQ